MTTTRDYATISREFMEQAQAELDAGDLIQASNSAWRATTLAFKAVAEPRGWPHSGTYDYYRIMSSLRKLTGRRELGRGFSAALALEENFYEGWFSENMVRGRMCDVAQLVADLHLLVDADIPIEKRVDEKKGAALTKDHRLASLIFMDEAETELEAGDMKRAPAKAWRATTRALMAITERRDWQRSGSYPYHQIIQGLIDETGKKELRRDFQVAESLWLNSYSSWMPETIVRDSFDDVKRLVADLHVLIDETDQES